MRGVLGALCITQDPICEGVTAVGVGGGEPGERVLVAPARPLNEIRLVHLDPPVGPAGLTTLPSMEPASRRNFSLSVGALTAHKPLTSPIQSARETRLDDTAAPADAPHVGTVPPPRAKAGSIREACDTVTLDPCRGVCI